MRENLAGDYYLVSDITFPAPGTEGLPGEGFEPVGRDTDKTQEGFQGPPFTGKFDGNGHTIRKLHIKRPDSDYIGLFGKIAGKVANVRLEEADISGRKSVGAIVGLNYGGYVSGVVSGGRVVGSKEHTGGLVGANYRGTVIGHSSGSVTGTILVGGLVGRNDQAEYATSGLDPGKKARVIGYATGSVSAEVPQDVYNTDAGGLVGFNRQAVLYGYFTGTVRSTVDPYTQSGFRVGSLVGKSYGSNARVTGYSRASVTLGNTDITNALTTTPGSPVANSNTGSGLRVLQEGSGIPDFSAAGFEFGEETGQWTFHAGKWPSINLGPDPIFADTRQPIEPKGDL